jgi:ParB family chromosome partitioning protein
MEGFDTKTLESDLHRLDLRFATLRIRQPRMVDRLARSIEQNGQLVPVVAVAEPENRWVLVDGYLRVEALHRLSRDTAWVELWECPLAQALLLVLVHVQGRTWEVIEEGAVIRELMTQFDLSQRELARQTGRDVSWVNRRLSLVQALPEALFTAICRGELSTWAASRVLVPLARANNAHAQTLLAALQRDPLSTRELHTWYQHYQKANQLKRERMLRQPRLFCHTRPRPGGQRVAGRTGRGLAGGVETPHAAPAWIEQATAIGLCGSGNRTAPAGLGRDENRFSGCGRDTGEVHPP